MHHPIRIDAPSNFFDVIRARLAAVDIAFRGPQVHVVMGFCDACNIRETKFMAFQLDLHVAYVCHSFTPPCPPCPSLFSRYVDNVLTITVVLSCVPNMCPPHGALMLGLAVLRVAFFLLCPYVCPAARLCIPWSFLQSFQICTPRLDFP